MQLVGDTKSLDLRTSNGCWWWDEWRGYARKKMCAGGAGNMMGDVVGWVKINSTAGGEHTNRHEEDCFDMARRDNETMPQLLRKC